jgi:glycine hydroxymethyltransferase
VLSERGLRVVSGGTDSYLFLVDLRAKKITGKDAEAALGRVHITVNKNAIPNDPQKPFVTSGIRIGSPSISTRGFTEIESGARAPDGGPPRRAGTAHVARPRRKALTAKFPVYVARISVNR